jgi:hypothetical protein
MSTERTKRIKTRVPPPIPQPRGAVWAAAAAAAIYEALLLRIKRWLKQRSEASSAHVAASPARKPRARRQPRMHAKPQCT